MTYQKYILKAGIKLPKSKRDWSIANEHFKSLLNMNTSDIETGISLMQSTIYDYFALKTVKTVQRIN